MKLNVSPLGNVIGGVIAAAIYFVVDVATGGRVGAALLGAVILGVIVFAISFVVSRMIVASRSGGSQ